MKNWREETHLHSTLWKKSFEQVNHSLTVFARINIPCLCTTKLLEHFVDNTIGIFGNLKLLDILFILTLFSCTETKTSDRN